MNAFDNRDMLRGIASGCGNCRIICNRSSQVNIGIICLEYGGGGHKNAGTCQIPTEDIDRVLPEIINKLKV